MRIQKVKPEIDKRSTILNMSAEENAAAPVDGEGEEKRKFIS
jgi:hypothetical protein